MSNNRPSFEVPPGAVAKVSIIDSTMRLSNLKADYTTRPPVEGFDEFSDMPLWSFLIESPGGRRALYDLGAHKELSRYAPSIEENVKKQGWKSEVKEDVADILQRHEMGPDEIDSVVWSHSHFDHTGDMTTFPASTELVVGPGFTDKWSPGFPTKADAPFREEDLAGRRVREISFDGGLKAGPFPAHDFFGDGSFYLLDAPGHCLGHIAGLARTSTGTGPDTFIMMGGDLVHHGGELRPSPYTRIPDPLPQGVSKRSGAWFGEMNVGRGRKTDEPFIEPSLAWDRDPMMQTIRWAQVADAQDNVWLVFAHDTSLFGSVDLFPRPANAWKEKGWKEKVEWKFLGDFEGN